MKMILAPLVMASALVSSTKTSFSSAEVSNVTTSTLKSLSLIQPACKALKPQGEHFAPRDLCQRTARACMDEMRCSAQAFHHEVSAAAERLEPRIGPQDIAMLKKVDRLYHSRTDTKALNKHLQDAESPNHQRRLANQRALNSHESELDFVHDRYVYPIMSEWENRQVSESKAIYQHSLYIRDNYQHFKSAADCLMNYTHKA